MAVQVADPEVQRAQGYALYEAHLEWSARQVAAGVDGPVPEGRKVPSDYNVHVPDMEANAQAQDEFHARAREIMGIPAELHRPPFLLKAHRICDGPLSCPTKG